MAIESFVTHFAELFEETDASLITGDTKFKELDEWNSLLSLSLIAMVDELYSFRLKGEDIKKSIYIKDIFNIIEGKK